MQLSIIIVNYNSFEYINKCLESISAFLNGIDYEVFVVDNNSDQKRTEEEFKIQIDQRVRFLFLEENIGFGSANNLAASKCNSEYLLFLNPDCVLIENFISPLIEYFTLNKEAGALSPMLVYEDGSFQSSTGSRMGLVQGIGEAFFLIGMIRKMWNRRILNRQSPVRVGWLSAACMLVRKSDFDLVGGFDKNFFLNYEDIDLCRRLEEAGLSNYYFHYYKCVHLDHKSFGGDYEKLVFSRYQSRLVYAAKHYGFARRQILRFVHIWGLILRLIFGNVLYSGSERSSRIRGYFSSLLLYFSPYKSSLQ